MSYSHRIFIYGPVGALLVLLAGYCLYWYRAEASFENWLDTVNHREAMPGVTIDFADKSIGGFPFRLDAVIGGVTVKLRGAQGESAWRAEKIAIHSLVYGGDQFVFEAAGLQSFAFPRASGPPQVYYVTPGIARSSAFLRNGKLARFDLDLNLVKGTDASAGEQAGRDFTAIRAQLHLLAQRTPHAMALSLKIDGATIGSGYHWALGHNITSLDIAGRIEKAGPFDAFLSGAVAFDKALADWRDAMGAMTIDKFALSSDTAAGANLTGKLSLDDAQDLTGRLTTPDGKIELVFERGEIR